MKEFNLTKSLKKYGAILILLFWIIVVTFNIYQNYQNYKKTSSKYIRTIINSKKEIVKNVVLQTVSMIDNSQKNALKIAYKKAKNNVYLAYNIARNLYNKLRNKLSNQEIEKIIIDAIKNIKLESPTDYFFIVKINGKVLLNSAFPKYEGKNFYYLKDNRGKFILQEMKKIVLEKGEGFYSYNWYLPNTANYSKKVSFIKYFKPLNFFIGNGVYINIITNLIQKDLLSKISGMRYSHQGYVFINKFDGTALITNGKIINDNKKLWELFKNKKRQIQVKRIFQKELDIVKNGKAGFMTCRWEKLKKPHKIAKMLIYLYPIKKWKWIVGSGIFLDDIEKFIREEKLKMYNNLLKNIFFLVLFTSIFSIISLFLINRFGNLIDEEFEKFKKLFEKAIKENFYINENDIKLYRLKLIANHINKILKEKFEISKKLEEEKEKLEITIKSVDNAIITTNTLENIEFMNPVAENLIGEKSNEVKGRSIYTILSFYDSSSKNLFETSMKKALTSLNPIKFDKYLQLKSHKKGKIYISGSIAPIKDKNNNISGLVIIFQDITEKLERENQLIKAEKLQAISILAGGIAHDFNNILTGISGNISLIELAIENNTFNLSKLEERLIKIKNSLNRAIHLTQQLLTFSKGENLVKENVNIKQLLEETIEFILAGSNIKANYNYKIDNLDIVCDKGQISHVIANLVINAKQAMPLGGNLYITVEDEINPKIFGEIKLGSFIKISIKDEGTGIKKELLEKIFDPFFTTKKDGNGLGLSIVYSIIKKHNGYITVNSKEDIGTEFIIYLPQKIHNKTKTINKKKHDLISFPQNLKNILIIDDDHSILELLIEIFDMFNINCTPAKNGEEALTIIDKKEFDLIITDLTIKGGKGGKEIISELKRKKNNIKVIVISGYSEDDVLSNYKKYGFDGRIKKPFTVNDIIKEINKIFNL